MINIVRTKRIAISAAAVAAIAALAAPQALAGFFSLVPTASTYAVLYEGNNTLQIKNVSITGDIGVGGTGAVKFTTPSTVTGKLDFSAADTGQYDNGAGNPPGQPSPINYSVAGVTTAISEINSLSSTVAGTVGTNIALTGPTTIDASTGVLDANGNRVFNVTSYSIADGEVVNIVGNGSDSVVLNFAFNNDVHLKGNITLGGGLTDDQVLWNFTSTNKNVSLDTNAGSSVPPSFHGIILAPNDVLLLTDANLNGRFWGGQNNKDMVLQNDSTLYPNQVVASTPEPSSVVLLLTALLMGLGTYRFRSGSGFAIHRLRSPGFSARGFRWT